MVAGLDFGSCEVSWHIQTGEAFKGPKNVQVGQKLWGQNDVGKI
jgi:hypothetical protein